MLEQLANGSPLTVRSMNKDTYSRIWDLDVATQLLLPLAEAGFTNPPAYDGPAGLYVSDRDMFAFMAPINVQRINMPTITSNDSSFGGFDIGGQMFYPFITTEQSEVGGTSGKFMGGLLQAICANHQIWGSMDVHQFTIRHVGKENGAWNRLQEKFLAFVKAWVTAGTLAERQAIQAAMGYYVAKDMAGTVEFLEDNGWTKKSAVETVSTIEMGDKSTGIISSDPTVLFNIVAARTALNRDIPFLDERIKQDKLAGQLMELVGANAGAKN